MLAKQCKKISKNSKEVNINNGNCILPLALLITFLPHPPDQLTPITIAVNLRI
jgi:hypothetical protein